jgi:S1-C subfamily serine protease
MDMRDVLRSGALKLPAFTAMAIVAATVVAAPVMAQSSPPAQPARVKRDSLVMLRVAPGTLERRLMFQIDSLRVILDREPLESADREKLRAETERLFRAFAELARANAELGAQVAAGVGAHVSTVIAQAMAQGGPAAGFRRFEVAAPRGWIGIVAEAPNEYRIVNDNQVIRYFDYPSIVSVDPNSPAARAGINTGDVLIAYDRSDVRSHDINLTRLLVPDRRLAVTVRRDGEIRDYEMTVARATQNSVRQRFETNIAGMDTLIVKAVPRSPSRAMSGGGAGGRMTASPNGFVMVGPTEGRARVFLSRSGAPLWGAQLLTINSGLARTVGISSGVLVVNVVAGTPAARSGLEDGDIIVKVEGQAVTDTDVLLKMSAERESERSLDLEILRAKKPVKVTLRWAR